MCTAPLVVNRKLAGQNKQDIVPCGRCFECLKQKQSQFAALSLINASEARFLHFLTLTYSNEYVPISVREDGKDFVFLEDRFSSDLIKSRFSPKNEPLLLDDKYYTLSLRRKDFQLCLKAFRESCRRSKIDISDMSFACFGEYGEHTARPHYHLLVYNLDSQLVHKLASFWNYGFVDIKEIPLFNQDGSNGFVAVSKYVSKYVGKDKYTHPFVFEGYVERPRRLSSKGFGLNIDVSNYRRFYLGEDLKHQHLARSDFLERLSERKQKFVFHGETFSMPRRIKELIYYDTESRNNFRANAHGKKQCERPKNTLQKLPVSSLLMAFERERNIKRIDEQLRKYSSKDVESVRYRIISSFIASQKREAENREEASKENILTHLTKEKYG